MNFDMTYVQTTVVVMIIIFCFLVLKKFSKHLLVIMVSVILDEVQNLLKKEDHGFF